MHFKWNNALSKYLVSESCLLNNFKTIALILQTLVGSNIKHYQTLSIQQRIIIIFHLDKGILRKLGKHVKYIMKYSEKKLIQLNFFIMNNVPLLIFYMVISFVTLKLLKSFY